MPRKPKQPCAYPGCPNLSDGRYCEQHRKLAEKNYEQYSRDPVVHKKYGRAWKRIRDSYVKTIHSVRSVLSKASLFRLMRYTTRFPSHRAAPMTEAI